jgi:hypothetical protein
MEALGVNKQRSTATPMSRALSPPPVTKLSRVEALRIKRVYENVMIEHRYGSVFRRNCA